MKIFIDSAEITEIEKAALTGLVDGVTTNPSLVAKSGQRFEDLIRRIAELVNGSISAEVTENQYEGMVVQGRTLSKIHPNVTVKLPMTWDGLRATRVFSEEGVTTNVTLCFSVAQAWLAAKAGATYVSPFVGRLDDIGQDGMALIRDIRATYDRYGFKTQILAASIRHTDHIRAALLAGADVATIPYSVFAKSLEHPLTEKGLATFLADAKKFQ